jgi:hypothetical protein
MKLHLLFATALAAFAVTAQARDRAQDEREILRVEAALCRAFETGDTKTLRDGLGEHFTLTDSSGNVTGLEQNLAEVARRDPVYETFRNHDQKIRLYGDAAVVTGITTLKGRSGTSGFAGDFQFTDTWIHDNGKWKMVSSHASRLQK